MASAKSRFRNHYKSNHWATYRKNLIEHVGFRCEKCGKRQSEGAILQVHHLHYVFDCLPWEYSFESVEVICKGCHADLHGKIPPKSGWDFVCDTDTGSINEQCDVCGTDIRYIYTVQHPDWGILDVGVECCDKMTSTDYASQIQKYNTSYWRRRKQFINSPKWKNTRGYEYRFYRGFEFIIKSERINRKYFIEMSSEKFQFLKGTKLFEKINDAKGHIFDIVENGEARCFWDKHVRKTRSRKIGYASARNMPTAISEI